MPPSKRTKMDPESNPYLAHLYEGSNGNGNGNGYGGGGRAGAKTVLSTFKRHGTTAEQAHVAEWGPENPFSGAPLSKKYFDILKGRRDLPVHKQR